jgi:hypothetical protein
MGRHYDCVNDTPMRALCGFVLWAESVNRHRLRSLESLNVGIGHIE